MKLKGQLNGLPILILVDSGASHNFVPRRVVKALNLPVQDTSSVAIRLGDGHRVLTKGTCNLKVDLGPTEASVTAYVFGLSGLDLILGIKWLETLGLVQTDSGQMTMTFYNKNELITLCGVKPKVATATSSLHNLIASKRLSFDKLFWNIQVQDQEVVQYGDLSQEQHEKIQQLLAQFPIVFTEAQGLPPHRDNDHAIVLQAGKGYYC
uniref:Uncharacterized protein n=1 Tax=Cajanus cajan TaxID=3821 RepID=A0A151R8Z6_CAJCA|nr:hypothetical protein KK1_039725 [Cajanus cajan]